MSHYDAALYTARRLEMCEIVEMTLFYFIDRPQVHSPLSGLPFMVSTLISLWGCESRAFFVPVFNEVAFMTQYTGSMLLCYWWVCIYGVIFLASFDLVLFKYSREPFNTICPIGTSSLAFVRATRIFSIVRAGFIRGERQFICLTMTSSCCLRQSLCFRDMFELYDGDLV